MAIFKSIDDVRLYVTFNKSATLALLQPHINRALSKYVRPILGAAELDALSAANDANSLSAAQTALLPWVQNCAALYMAALAMPTQALHFSDMGIQEVQSKDGSTSGVRQWLYFEVQAQVAQAGDEAAEDLLQFVESRAADYPLWAASEQFTISRELFINSATELGYYVDTRGSRRLWLAIRPYIKNFTEAEWILPSLGQEQFDELKAQILADSLTPENGMLLAKIQKVVAFAGTAKALAFLNVILSADGLRMASSGNYAQGQNSKVADMELRDRFRKECEGAAAGALTQLQEFILKNIADYPLIAASDASPVDLPEQPYEIAEQTNSSAWRVP